VNAESSLAAKLEELMTDSGERKRLKNAALARARENYNWGKVADEYERILEKLSPKKISGM
jgi:glycosyltransferase involved in cell wall biosynthesis